jgi:signal transduction histidine kinase
MRTEPRQTLTALRRPAREDRTVRVRLTLLYGGLFAACGATLLAITYVLVRHFTAHVQSLERRGPLTSTHDASGSGARLPPLPSLAALQRRAEHALVHQHSRDLHELLVWSIVALAVMIVASIALGWLVAGHVLRPLQTALDAQRRFVANASHELRTPLTRIRTALDVAVGKPGPPVPEVVALDGKLREGLDRADALLESFLTLSRAEYGDVADYGDVRLDEVIRAALLDHAPEIAARRIDVRQELNAVVLTGSPTLIGRMVENVIDNGTRHNVPDGWMRIALDSTDGRARLTVESSGVALDPAQVGDLAQPFRRIGAERTGSERGSGLGLSIVAAIASAHAGTVELEARDGGGLRVVIELPRAPTQNGTA